MLIVDISATVENMVTSFNKKMKELEDLKREYQEKLKILNTYIDRIQTSGTNLQVTIGDKEIINLLSSEVSCPNCLENLYNLNQSSEYFLIPKKKVRLICEVEEPKGVNKMISTVQTSFENLQVSRQPSSPIAAVKKVHHSNLKKTCSYCKKRGHSRAHCFTRLSKDPSESKSHDFNSSATITGSS